MTAIICRSFVTGLIAVAYMVGMAANTTAAGDSPERIVVASFSALPPGSDIPPQWEPLVFKKIKKRTRYSLVSEGGTTVVRAVSDAAASGLIRKMLINPKAYPILEWRWKVSNILEKGDVSTKAGDDYAARIYVTFAYDPTKLSFLERTKYKTARMLYGEYPPTAALNYIWGSHADRGLSVSNPYTERARMIVVESGPAKVGQWLTHTRNLLEDYRGAFQTDPPMISGIAIMTDTDNTGESATAFYGDIILRSSP